MITTVVMFFLPFAFAPTYLLVHSLQDLRQRPTTQIKNIITKTGAPPPPPFPIFPRVLYH